MNQEDYDKVKEALDPLYQRVKILLNGVQLEGFRTDEEIRNSNKNLKDNIKTERKMIIVFIIWVLIWACITCITGQILSALEYFGLNISVITGPIIILMFGFIGFVGAIVIAWKIHKIKKVNKSDYDSNIVQYALQDILPGATCEPESFLDPNRLYHLGIIPYYTEASGSYLIEYEENGQKCFISNLFLTRQKIGNQNRMVSEVVFSGQAYILKYNSVHSGNVRIITKGKDSLLHKDLVNDFKRRSRDEEKIETGNSEFDKYFNVYASDSHMSSYCCSPYMIQHFLEWRRIYGSFGIAITGSTIAVALDSKQSLFKMPVRYNQIDNISIENSKLELKQILSLAQQIENVLNGKIYG